MANTVPADSALSAILVNETIPIVNTCCSNCVILNLKLEEVYSELSSAREIIKILQEESSLIQSATINPRASQLDCEEDYSWTEIPYANWTTCKPSRKNSRANHSHSLREVFPIHVNRYNALSSLIEPETSNLPSSHKLLTTPKKFNKNNGKKCSINRNNTRKIVIIGDSHARGCAAIINHIFGKTVTATGYVSPGSNLQHLTKIVKTEINNLTKKDVLVIWGGANNIAKNETNKGLIHLFKLLDLCTNTNVITVGAPKRHDLLEASSVNDEVNKFNQKLHKMMSVFSNVRVVNSVSHREYYTKHGLHLNNIGKEEMASRIIEQCKDSRKPNESPPIFLQWIKVPSISGLPSLDSQSGSSVTSTIMPNHCHQSVLEKTSLDAISTDIGHKVILDPTKKEDEVNKCKVSDGLVNQSKLQTRNSNRLRKQPVSKTNNFLWL